MTSWVENIIQALEKLGGYAHFTQIVDTVKKMSPELLPLNITEIIQAHLQAQLEETNNSIGDVAFVNLGNGIWALRESDKNRLPSDSTNNHDNLYDNGTDVPKHSISVMNEWAVEIVEILKVLGGKAPLKQIYIEFRANHPEHLPSHWHQLIQGTLQKHSSVEGRFDGNHYFYQVEKGVWQLMGDSEVDVSQALLAMPSKHTQKRSTRDKAISQIFNTTESFEDIENIRRTIKEYREYYEPKSLSWKNYIHEIFSILGFSVTIINPRLATLNVIGANHKPNALVAFIQPEENFEEAAPGFTWDSHLLFAASFYQLDWGILTDGLQMKVNQYEDHQLKQTHYWPQFDESVCEIQSATFLSMYKVISSIKGTIKLDTSDSHIKFNQSKKIDYEIKPGQYEIVREFLHSLLDRASLRTHLHAKTRVGRNNYVSASAGKRGITYHYVAVMDRGNVDLYIDSNDKDWNKSVFKTLFSQRQEIERGFGQELEWQLLPDNRASRVRYTIYGYDLRIRDQWEGFQDQLIDAMIKLDKVIRPFIQTYS
jgi:hypothetical protein